jgi:DNA-binding transcriptional MerR regulator
VDKAPDAFRTISEVAEDLDMPQHVLRFWETRFPQVKPLKRGGGRRYYRPEDVDLLRGIRHLLYGQGYTIRGVQRLFKEQGVRFVAGCWRPGAPALRPAESDQAADAVRSEPGPERGEALRHRFGAAAHAADTVLEAGHEDRDVSPASPPSAGPPAASGRVALAGAVAREELRTAVAQDAETTSPAGGAVSTSRLSDAAVRRLRAVLSELQEIKRVLDGA